MSVSVLILTYNEEANLPACLDSLAWCDDILVFDSFSTDRTVRIGQDRGARVIQHRFENYGAQREAARAMGAFKHPWVLALDADERPDAELVAEMRAIAAAPLDPGPVAYRMRRKDHFFGQWIRHATLYPSWFIRFFRPDKITYPAHSVHEYPDVHGSLGSLKGHLLHYSFNKGLADWWSKHARYAAMEGRKTLEHRASGAWPLAQALSLDPVRRRRGLKALSYRLPFRGLFRLLYMYILRGGFLDGWAGWTYCRMLAFYEYMIVLNAEAEERRSKGLPV